MTKYYKLVTVKAGSLTPIDLFERLNGKKKFLLESTFLHEQKGKYSFIGADPYLEVISEGKETILRSVDGHVERLKQHPLNFLKSYFPKIEVNLPIPFYGGAIGYISYDTIHHFVSIGEAKVDEIKMPDVHFMLYKSVIVFDHEAKLISFITLNLDGEPEDVLEKRLAELQNVLTRKTVANRKETCYIDFQFTMTEQQFKEKVEIIKQHIENEEVAQVVLSQRMKGKLEGDSFTFYLKLREVNPSPYMFYIDFEDYQILGASPESLVQTKNDEVITNPIAGTRHRGMSVAEDKALEKELLTDKKELAEHDMLVELSRNDLERVCEASSIHSPTYMKIEKYQHVMHIVSEVRGKLKEDFTSIDALLACLPAGTVSGMPKNRAMQIINKLEEQKRGVYAGGIGYINVNLDINFALAIRSLVIKDDLAFLQAGAGIVKESDPTFEYNETLNKARSIMEIAKQISVKG